MSSPARVTSRKRRREKPNFFCPLPASSPPPSLSLECETAAPKWSTEVLSVIETHLALLRRRYQHGHQGVMAEHYPAMHVNDLEGGTDCLSSVLNGNEGHCGSDVEESDVRTTQLVDLMSCQAASLPEDWEQHLDLRTGQVFYIHWKSCKKSKVDPRKIVQMADNRIAELMNQTREEPSHHELHCSMKEEASPSECITSQSASIALCIDEDDTEIQSKPTSFCYLHSRAQCFHPEP